MNKSEQIKQLLNEFANMFLEIDSWNAAYNSPLDEEDVMNATLIFNSVIGNHAIHTAIKWEKWLSKDNIEEKWLEFANNLADKIKEYIQLDTRSYYK